MGEQLTAEQIVHIHMMYAPCKYISTNPIDKVKEGIIVGGSSYPSVEGCAFTDIQFMEDGEEVTIPTNCFDTLKMVLRPLSAISDKDAIEVSRLIQVGKPYPPSIEKIREYMEKIEKGYSLIRSSVYQYLIQQGYAVPLWFRINHPLDGKTAIECGLAIDVSTINKG